MNYQAATPKIMIYLSLLSSIVMAVTL